MKKDKCPFCTEVLRANSEELYWHIKIHNVTTVGLTKTHKHNYVSKSYIGTWSATAPPPTMLCTKCGNWI